MRTYNLTNEQARNFLLLKQGLIGEYKFNGRQGILDFIKQAGCIQFDPIDVCGKNAELVLQSRVSGFTKKMLYELLYVDRKLVDYFDKNMAIFCTEDWKYFSRCREHYRLYGRSREKVDSAADEVKRVIGEKGYACSKDIHMKETVDWAWNPTTLSRAALETLYFCGELIIHHKKGTIKHYALAKDYIDKNMLNAEDPNKTEDDFTKWQVLRRIGSIGLLWDKPSDAWLGISGFKGGYRSKIFSSLISENRILECNVENVSYKLYFLADDEPLIEKVLSKDKLEGRMEFIAPLDNIMWDRKLIKEIFGFDYKWEIYTPVNQRKYGYYVLPVLYGNQFVGRIEIVVDKSNIELVIRNFWKEKGVKPGIGFHKQSKTRLAQFANFNKCHGVIFNELTPCFSDNGS